MDPRTAAHVLGQIAAHLELRGESTLQVARVRAGGHGAARARDRRSRAPLSQRRARAKTRGLGPATLSVVRDLIETGESSYLEQLRATTPSGLLDLLRVPGLGTAKIHKLHEALGIDSVESLEEAAARRTRREAASATAPRRRRRSSGGSSSSAPRARGGSIPQRAAEGARTARHGARASRTCSRAEVAGSVRRQRETVGDVDIVAACRESPARSRRIVRQRAGCAHGARRRARRRSTITYVDGTCLDLHCVEPSDFAVALWRATGSSEHVAPVAARLGERGFALDGDRLVDERDALVPIARRSGALRARRTGVRSARAARGPRRARCCAATGRIPALLELADIRGVLHCHSTWSDGKATIAEMADAARERGWSYIGITDHSQAAFYAGGLSRERVLAQHDEIDALNATRTDVRILKGVECDILADGTLDYGDDAARPVRLRRRLGALAILDGPRDDDGARAPRPRRSAPHHPRPSDRTAAARRASRIPIDVDAVLEKAAAVGVAVELNADPHRLDLDWRLHPARARARRPDRDRPRCAFTTRTRCT